MKPITGMKKVLWAILFAAQGTSVLASPQTLSPLFNLPQPEYAPERLLALIEIPAGSRVKYEIDPVHGGLMVDRILPASHSYPAHYGALPSVWAGDGDLMDVLVISEAELVPGALIEVIPVGLAKMMDRGERDDKVLTVPADVLGSNHDEPVSLASLPAETLKAIEAFFLTYKAQPGSQNPIEWQGFVDGEALTDWWHEIQTIQSPYASRAEAGP